MLSFNAIKIMNTKLHTIITVAFVFASTLLNAQYSGGIGRGDIMAETDLLQILSCSNPTYGGTIAAAQTICYDTAPDELTSSELPTGHTGDIEYQWQLNTEGAIASFDKWEDAGTVTTTATYDHIGTLTQTIWFRRLARVPCDPVGWASATASNVVEVSVRTAFNPGEIANTGETICYNTTAGEIGSVTDATGGDENITYFWRSSVDSFTADITDADVAAYTPGTLTQTTAFRRYAKDETCISDPVVSVGTWTVTVQDELTTTCPSDISVNNDPAHCQASVTFEATAGGAPEPVLTYTLNGYPISSPHVFSVGTHTVVATASNDCGSVSCTFRVTVTDNEKPVVITKNIIVNLDNTGNAIITPDDINNGSFDNCDIATMTLDRNDFSCDDMGGTYTVTLTVTDVNGNVDTGEATVTVNELSVPATRVNIRATSAPDGQVKFTATPVNGGDTPTYQWFKNGNPINGETDSELITTCNSGDEHYVVMTSSIPCTAVATSNVMCTY